MKSYDEIVRALQHCSTDMFTDCAGCPYLNMEQCRATMEKDARTLILKQHYAIDVLQKSETKTEEPVEHSEPNTDNVNHPKHYESGKFECIEVMQEAIGAEATKHFCLCNAFKYIYRCNKKHSSPVEDVKKAVWYLNKFLEVSNG